MKVAINGFGRIGRLIFRIMDRDNDFDIVAINDLTDAKQLAYLLKYDTTQGSYIQNVTYKDNYLIVGNKKILILSESDPKKLPWKKLGIDLVFECTGIFTKKDDALLHIKAGAKKVIISAPAKGDLKTIVYGVNHEILDGKEKVISSASCTTNCLAPTLKIIDDNFGIIKGYMTTVHAYTNDQANLDVAHRKGIESRRGRASAQNIVPTSTGAAEAIGNVLPSLNGKLSGGALRVPVASGSVIDLVLELNKKVTKEEVNETFRKNQNKTICCTDDPIVSSDVIGSHCGVIVDLGCTNVLDVDDKQLVKILSWYDNEMGYSAQMVRTAKYWLKK